MTSIIAAAIATSGAAACSTTQERALTAAHRASLNTAIASSTRTPANVQRDRYRNPGPTLAFFGVRPSDTVVEIWPGGGWYTEILAPYLRSGGGTYIAAAPPTQVERFTQWRDTNQAKYGVFRVAAFPTFEPAHQGVAPGTADVVLTFRNVHNWRIGSGRDNQDYSAEAFRQLYAMLKPGGTLGIVDHRLPEGANAERERSSGYMKVSTVRRLAEQAGFRFVASSEINANPGDTADWPQGVWTLPPVLRLGEQDRERYLAIGESDRMTLRFVKPR
jgi:predicted methyltransferase